MRILKILVNSVLLRGRNRIPRLIFLAALCVFVFTLSRLSVCSLVPSMCADDGTGGKEVSIIQPVITIPLVCPP